MKIAFELLGQEKRRRAEGREVMVLGTKPTNENRASRYFVYKVGDRKLSSVKSSLRRKKGEGFMKKMLVLTLPTASLI